MSKSRQELPLRVKMQHSRSITTHPFEAEKVFISFLAFKAENLRTLSVSASIRFNTIHCITWNSITWVVDDSETNKFARDAILGYEKLLHA